MSEGNRAILLSNAKCLIERRVDLYWGVMRVNPIIATRLHSQSCTVWGAGGVSTLGLYSVGCGRCVNSGAVNTGEWGCGRCVNTGASLLRSNESQFYHCNQITWSVQNADSLITSRITGRGYGIGTVFLCVCVCACVCVHSHDQTDQ